jgi:solute carrier family 35, member E1
MNNTDTRWSVQSNPSNPSDTGTTKFPDFDPSVEFREHSTIYENSVNNWDHDRQSAPSPNTRARLNGTLHSERWAPRKDYQFGRANGAPNGLARGHNRQKSLSDAIRTIQSRKGSVSANAQEIAEALKAPVSMKLVVCVFGCASVLSLISSQGTLLNLVFQLCIDQYILKIYTYSI